MEARFNEKMHSDVDHKCDGCRVLCSDQQLTQKVHETKSKTSGKQSEDYQRLKRYVKDFEYEIIMSCEIILLNVTSYK